MPKTAAAEEFSAWTEVELPKNARCLQGHELGRAFVEDRQRSVGDIEVGGVQGDAAAG